MAHRFDKLAGTVVLYGVLSAAVSAGAPSTGRPAARPVFQATFASSLSAVGADITFVRASEATCFDPLRNRIVTVPADTPRFAKAPASGKGWGASTGVFLEGGTRNLLVESSFEGTLDNWTFSGKVEKRKGIGVHGQHGLVATGPASVTHKPIRVNMCPKFCTYVLSVYVRRADGGKIGLYDAYAQGRPTVAGPWGPKQSRPIEPTRLGDGPWYRVSARIGDYHDQKRNPPSTDMLTFRFAFRKGGTYHVDAAQLEYLHSWPHLYSWDEPSSYVPTAAEPATRAPDVLYAPAKDVLPGRQWTYSFWHYAAPPDNSRGHHGQKLFGVWDGGKRRGRRVLLTTRRCTEGARPGNVTGVGWASVTVTFDGQKMDVFFNGLSDHTRHGPFPAKLPQPMPGTAYWAAPWQDQVYAPMGLIADFTTWDRALTADEVRGLYQTGKPVPPPPAKGGIPVELTLNKPGRVSVNVYRDGGQLVHQLLIGKPLKAGTHRVQWDGCDDKGQPVPKGRYSFKGLSSNVRSVWDGKVCNTSPSPGGEWKQYRTGHYYDVAALSDGGVVTLPAWGEHGRVIQAIGGPPDYPVRWCANGPWPAFGVAAAVDGPYVYTLFTHWLPGGKLGREGVGRWLLKNGAPKRYKATEQVKTTDRGEVWLNAPHAKSVWITSPPEDRNNPYSTTEVCGLAARRGKLYVPYLKENRVGVLDANTGRQVASFACPHPRKVALDAAGRVYVTSGKHVLRFAPDGTGKATVVTGLDDACAIAVGPKGTTYVTDLGSSHQVKVFDAQGAAVRTFGRAGGHHGGRVRPDLLDCPLGIAVGADGTVFVADLGGFRVLVLNTDFTLRKVIHGRMPYAMSVSELNRSLVYQGWPSRDIMEYTVDYGTRTATMSRRWNNATHAHLRGFPFFKGGSRVYFRRWGKRTFAICPAYTAVAEIDGDRLLPRVWLGYTSKHPEFQFPKAVVNDGVSWSLDKVAGGWEWRDRNADGVMQASEVEFTKFPLSKTYHEWHGDGWVDAQGNLYHCSRRKPRGVIQLPFGGLDEHGFPKYSYATAKYVLTIPEEVKNVGSDGKLYSVCPESVVRDKAGNYYVSDQGDMFSTPPIPLGILKYTKDGQPVWRVGRHQSGPVWHPGEVQYCGQTTGLVDDRYLFFIDYRGQMNVWDTDGLWIARLFGDLPGDLFLPGETFHGAAFRHPNGKVYAYSSPDCVYRTSRIVVDGLEGIERFAGTVEVKTLAKPRRVTARERLWLILRRRDTIRIDGEMNPREWGTDTDRQAPEHFYHNNHEVARSWAQYDGEALYLAWKIKDPTPAVNKNRGEGRWQGDQVEFMIRAARGTTGVSGSRRHSAVEYQMAIGPDGDGRLSAFVQLNGSPRKGKDLPGVKVGLHILPRKNGYTMEARIPWGSLGDYRPAKGDKIRWSMNVDWGTPDGRAFDHHSKWMPGIHINPQSWGVALFE